MFSIFRNAWKIKDLRNKILYTLLILLVFRIGSALPLPFVNIIGELDTGSGSLISYLNVLTGNAFQYGTLFAMSVSPYINASIIIQLLTVAIPALEKLSKEGEEGRKKISVYTRYTAVILGLVQSVAYYIYLKNQNFVTYQDGFPAFFTAAAVILSLTAGTALLMWLGEQINQKGIGNGISMLLFAGIVSRGPAAAISLYSMFVQGGLNYFLVPLVVLIFLAIIGFIVWMDNAERRIPVQYAKRVVGRKMYGGQSSHMPIKVNMSGVLPIIFASSILSIPATIEMFVKVQSGGFWAGVMKFFSTESWSYAIVYFLLIIGFAYFYASIQYNPIEMANNLRQNSGTVPGIRPGKPTSDYIMKIMSRIVLVGALCLSVIAILPIVFGQISGLSVSLGGTSVIILVGVALETVKSVESQMLMRHYKGFLE